MTGPDKYLIRDGQRIIEAIEALLVRIHNAQEGDIYEQAASELGGIGRFREPEKRKSERSSVFDRALGVAHGAKRVQRIALSTLLALVITLGGG